MKYVLNKLPVKTTNSFKVNDVELDFTLPKFQMNHDFELEGDLSLLKIKKQIKKNCESSKIGIEFDEYYDIQISVPKNIQIEKPILIHYSFEKDEAIFSKISIHYEENTFCNFVILIESSDDCSHFSHISENVFSKKDSQGNLTFINLLNQNSKSFYALENDVLENASIIHTIVDLGGKTRLYNAYTNLLEKNSSNTLNTIYIGKNDELLDFNYYLNNIGCDTNNQIKVEGVLDDCCCKNFRGTIDFIKGCTNAIGEENENCVLLSDSCRSRSLPQLLCGEENVFGTHGVSSGRVSEDKLFYLMSRGYTKKEAEKFIVLGNFMSILNFVPHDRVRERIINIVDKFLS